MVISNIPFNNYQIIAKRSIYKCENIPFLFVIILLLFLVDPSDDIFASEDAVENTESSQIEKMEDTPPAIPSFQVSGMEVKEK